MSQAVQLPASVEPRGEYGASVGQLVHSPGGPKLPASQEIHSVKSAVISSCLSSTPCHTRTNAMLPSKNWMLLCLLRPSQCWSRVIVRGS